VETVSIPCVASAAVRGWGTTLWQRSDCAAVRGLGMTLCVASASARGLGTSSAAGKVAEDSEDDSAADGGTDTDSNREGDSTIFIIIII